MGAIGAFTFIRMEGAQVPALAVQMTELDRPHVNGYVYRADAKKVPAIMLTTYEAVALAATANAAVDDYQVLIGSLVTVVDDRGRSVANVMITAVQVIGVNAMLTPVPAGNNYIVKAVWSVKPTA